MASRIALLIAILAALQVQAARADMRSDAVRLLAARVRESGAHPEAVVIRDVVVNGNQALLSWNSGKARGMMGLVTAADRWWDAFDLTQSAPSSCWDVQVAYPLAAARPYAAGEAPPAYEPAPLSSLLRSAGFGDALASTAAADADARGEVLRGCSTASRPVDLALHPSGGTIHAPLRVFTSGYDITIAYARNDAAPGSAISQIFARAPSEAEFAPSHASAPGWGGPDAVCFFDISIVGPQPVRFARGSTLDVWFPFVLDDQLRYNVSFFSAGKPSGMIFGSVFDNTLHFELPPFALDTAQPLMAEIDGDPKGSAY